MNQDNGDGRISGAKRRKPGYPLVSFLPQAKKDTASIPCAEEEECAWRLTPFSQKSPAPR
jgi:hypothetical protein